MLLKLVSGTNILNLCKFCTNIAHASTIFALSSGQGKCGVAVIRVSGPQAGAALKKVTGMELLPKPRFATLRSIQNPQTREVLDKGIVIWFPGPRSFTGEDSCELQIHGGHAVIAAVLKALGLLENLRLAEPGEFTRRAFYNGKLDLTEVEGIADLLSAETEAQRKQAYLQTEGCLSKLYQEWRGILIKCVAHLEAHIDFGETETIEINLLEAVTQQAKSLSEKIARHLDDGHKGELLRKGVKTVILGEPNVGKSSLLNALCQRPAAIVTPLEGTTRDVLEVTLDIGDYPLVLLDTAGLRLQTADIVEKEGIKRAINAYQEADLVVLVIDCVTYLTWHKSNYGKSLIDFLKFYVEKLNINEILNKNGNEFSTIFNKHCILVVNKIDLIGKQDMHIFESLKANIISCTFEIGFPSLLKEITNNLKFLCGEPSMEHPSMSQARHRQHLTQCLKHLKVFLKHGNTASDIDCVLMAEELKKALRQLGKIAGIVTTEQLLDVIFKEFCIGK